jgi:hypothetical protein
MSARLRSQLEEADLDGRLLSELDRAAERRRVQRGRRRWRAVAAAAVIVVLGGAAIAAMRGPLGDDLRTRPGDDPVSVAEPDDSTPSSTVAGDDSSGDVDSTETDDEGAPIFSPDDDKSGDLGVSSEGSSGVETTEVPEEPDQQPPPDTADSGSGQVDWGQVADDCGQDQNCWMGAAEQACEQAGPECWAQAAGACGNDYGCRAMLAQTCGDTRQCWEAIFDDPDRHRGS